MSGTTKPKPSDLPAEPTEDLVVRVPIRALSNYSNGTIPVSVGWRANEVRYVTMGELLQLRNDLPNNFEAAPDKE